MDQIFTPASAARHAKCGRSSIMRALQSKELKADRDNKNRWKITLEALEIWIKNRPDNIRSVSVTEPVSVQVNDRSHDDIAKIASLESEVAQLNLRLDDARADNDKLLSMMAEMTKPSPSLWARIWGSRSN